MSVVAYIGSSGAKFVLLQVLLWLHGVSPAASGVV